MHGDPDNTGDSQTTNHHSSQQFSAALERAQESWRQIFRQHVPLPPMIRPTVLTTTNLRNNGPWGDELGPKPEGTTRIYSINVNGISLDRRGGTYDDICRIAREIQVDILCLQEHNIDSTQFQVRSILYDTTSKHWQRNRLVIGTTPVSYVSTYKPGGTMMTSTGSITGRVSNQTRDKWGRWVTQELTGRGNRKIVIISAYQPVDRSSHPGSITVASQQRSLLIASQDPTTNPRTAFRRDLLLMLRPHIRDQHSIILLGDFNEVLGSDQDGMIKIATELNLIDIMRTRHSSIPPPTYARGTKRLDYILTTPDISNALTATGYDAFNSRINSDHRGYFLDLDTAVLFGSPTQDLITLQHRGLQSKNLYQVTEYIRRKHKLLSDHNVFERAERLRATGDRHQLAERLDATILQASLEAENHVRKVGEPAWSIELRNARRTVALLTKHLSYLRHSQDRSSQFQSDWIALGNSEPLPTNIPDVSLTLRKAKDNVKDIVRQSYQRRDEERQQRIRQLESSQSTADRRTAQRLRRLKKAEDIKNLFQKLKHVRTQSNRKGVTRIEIPLHPDTDPKSCTQWRQIEVPTEILRLIQERNKEHFGQAQGTPFTTSPLSDDLGFTGNTATGDAILAGHYNTDDLDSNVALLIRHIAQGSVLTTQSIQPTITDEAFCGKLRVWAESTTTSPSGLHLGHYKALIARHSYSTDAFDDELSEEFKQARDELNQKQRDLRLLHLQMLNYALERGYSYRRWQQIANTILFKDPDNVRLDRTRVIHIYEADYNLILGIQWRAALFHAEDSKTLNDGQYGSRPHRTAIDPVFGEELQCEISRATRKPVILLNYDAKACYDRILPCIALLVSRKYGVPREVTQLNMTTLENATYRIRTELGLAESGYRHSVDAPIFGTGQGSANSPAIWCFISCMLFDAYESLAQPADYVSPDNQITTSLGLLGFVDDCNGQTNAFRSEGPSTAADTLLAQTRDNAQHWSNLLHASGGALELSKCSCQVIEWMFTNQGAPVLAPKNNQHQSFLKVKDPATMQDQTLELLSPYQAHKTLGHFKDPAGTQNTQFRKLQQKSDELTTFLWTCPLSRLEAWTFYHACYLPSITYPLATSFMTKSRLDTIQKKAMSIIIPRCGFNRHTKKEILYGPMTLGGASFRPLFVEQGVGQIQLFIRHWRSQSITGRLLRIAVQWFQHQIGTSKPFLTHVHDSLPHFESKWLKSLRDFLANIQSELHLDNAGVPNLQRTNDFHIMDAILQSNTFSDLEIRRLNYCRLYLRAQTISDLTLPTGRKLDASKLAGQPSLQSSRTRGVCINQERPAESEWILWRRANRLWSDPDGLLFEELGPWIRDTQDQRQQHQVYFTHESMWIRSQSCYVRCVPISEFGCYRETQTSRLWEELPTATIPATAHLIRPDIWKLDITGGIKSIHRTRQPATFDQYVSNQQPWEAELLSHLHLEDDAFTTAWKLSFGIRGVSDGSVWLKTMGAFGWVLSTDTGERVAECMGPAPGASPNSYRSEAYGLLSLLTFITRLFEFTGQHEPWSGIVASDNEGLVKTVWGVYAPLDSLAPEPNSHHTFLQPAKPLPELSPEWDLVHNIRQLLHTMPNLRLQHVLGHQDRSIAYQHLSLLSQLNVQADKKANQYQRDFGAQNSLVTLTNSAGVHLVMPHGTVTSHYAAATRYQATYLPLKRHLMQKYGWNEHITGTINWAAHGTSLRARAKQRIHFVKLVQDLLPTNHALYRKDPDRRKCPSCSHPDEDWKHILKCPATQRCQWRIQFIAELQQTCQKLATCPILAQILRDGIQGWLDADLTVTFELPPDIYPDDYRVLISQQNIIGWEQLFMGRFAWRWSDLQGDFYSVHAPPHRNKSRTGLRWQTQIIKLIWDQWLKLWSMRNEDVHGHDKSSLAQIDRRNAIRTLRELYSLRELIEPSARSILMTNIQDHEQKPTWQIKNWIATNEALLRASHRHVKKKSIQGMRSLRTYFDSR